MIATEMSKKLTELLEAYAKETGQVITKLEIRWRVVLTPAYVGRSDRITGISVTSSTDIG